MMLVSVPRQSTSSPPPWSWRALLTPASDFQERQAAAVGAAEPAEPFEEAGWRVAWEHQQRAARALIGPFVRQLPPLTDATRTYVIACIALYGYFALAFLTKIPGVGGGATGVELVDAPPLHLLWGLSTVVVALSQIAVLLIDWRMLWRISAVVTAAVAGAFEVAFIVVSLHAHSYGGIVFWGFILTVHLLFVAHHLVPIRLHETLPPHEAALLEQLRQTVARDDAKQNAKQNAKQDSATTTLPNSDATSKAE